MVSLVYTATFADGQFFDANTEQTPLLFTVGSGQTLQGLDEAVIGKTLGKTYTITVAAEKWYGKFYDNSKIQKISQLIFDKLSIKATSGSMQKLGTIEWVIKGTEKDSDGNILVLFDINPRQTRDTLTYTITLLQKKLSTDKK